MGYRSVVELAFLVTQEVEEAILCFTTLEGLPGNYLDKIDWCEVYYASRNIYYLPGGSTKVKIMLWECVKWCPRYADVPGTPAHDTAPFIFKLLRYLDSCDLEKSYCLKVQGDVHEDRQVLGKLFQLYGPA